MKDLFKAFWSIIILIMLAVGTTMLQQAHAQNPPSHKREIQCLAYNIYYEAHNQSFKGRKAVANVTINRKKSKNFSNTICGVVYDKSQRLSGKSYCEFSWAKVTSGKYCSRGDNRPNRKVYKDIYELAEVMLSVNQYDVTGGALFYHADYVNGGWFKKNLTYIKHIGNHKFYK